MILHNDNLLNQHTCSSNRSSSAVTFPFSLANAAKRQNQREREEKVPLAITFQAHGMVATGQHNLAIQLHANPTLIFPFNVHIRVVLLIFLHLISPPVPLAADCLLPLMFCICNPSFKLE